MTWILGMARRSSLLPLFGVCGIFALACSTDVDYLRAGRTGGGAGDDTQTGGAGGGAGASADPPDADVDGPRAEPEEGGPTEVLDATDASSSTADESTPSRPTGITFGIPEPTTQLTPSDGGASFIDTCLSNQVAIGFNGTVDGPTSLGTYPKSIQVICGALSVSGAAPYEVKTAMAATLPKRGDGSVVPINRMCPADRVVVGFDGRAGMFVDQLIFRCAALTISGGPADYVLSIGQPAAIDPIGGAGGMTMPQTNCAAGSLAIGSVVRAGQAIDAFGLSCAKASLTFARRDTE